ncbi:hypothetical protein QTP88_022585 [Uroleucon formosanum]
MVTCDRVRPPPCVNTRVLIRLSDLDSAECAAKDAVAVLWCWVRHEVLWKMYYFESRSRKAVRRFMHIAAPSSSKTKQSLRGGDQRQTTGYLETSVVVVLFFTDDAI